MPLLPLIKNYINNIFHIDFIMNTKSMSLEEIKNYFVENLSSKDYRINLRHKKRKY